MVHLMRAAYAQFLAGEAGGGPGPPRPAAPQAAAPGRLL